MNKEKITLKFIFALLFAVSIVFSGGCTDEPQETINNPSQIGPDRDPPVIDDVQPQSALAGVSQVVINGQNFSATAENNLVFFNAQQADILEATETRLTVMAPDVVGDSVKLKIAVQNVELYSNTIYYKMNPAVNYVSPDIEADRNVNRKYYGITIDAEGNVYSSITEQSDQGRGILEVTPDGDLNTFAEGPSSGLISKFDRLRLGPNDEIYCANAVPGIFKMVEGASGPETWVAGGNGINAKVYDMDFDQNLNLWAGSDDKFFRVTQDKDVAEFEFDNPGRTVGVRVYDGYVYVALIRDEQSMVVRYEIISADELGDEEVYFTFDSGLENYRISGVTFDNQGTMYVGLNSEIVVADLDRVIIKVYSDGSYEDLYPRLVEGDIYNPRVYGLRYGQGNKLYYVRQQALEDRVTQDVIWVDTTVPTAPHYK
jgi:hypothetical protein